MKSCRACLRRWLPPALGALLAGCSLLSIKTPEKPLSPRDLNARILAHAFAVRFDLAVEQTADEIAAADQAPAVRQNALRWKIAATAASERGGSQVIPMLGLLDLWALSDQMQAYLTDGKGGSLFGMQQFRAVTLAGALSREAQSLARGLLEPAEFEADRRFVEQYARTYPIEGLDFARASVVDAWVAEKGSKQELIPSLGTVPEAVADAVDVLRMYGESAPSQALWRAELAVQDTGLSGDDVKQALARLDSRMERLSALADSTPKMVDGAMRDARRQFDAAWVELIATVRSERGALSATLSVERQAALEALDKERTAVDADAERIASRVIEESGRQARILVREALLLTIGLAVVVLGLPFIAGYYVGRSRRSA